MNATAVIVGAVLIPLAALMIRFRDSIARWQIDGAVEGVRRRSLSNSEYVDREVRSLRTPGSLRLQRLIVVVFAAFVAVAGVWAIVRGLGFGA